MSRRPFDPTLIQPPDKEKHRCPEGPLTVSQVTALVKEAIESVLPATVHVVGEISNFTRHASGHLYLTLKDRHCELSCVMWRSAATSLKFNPADGMEVLAAGRVELFERAGRYQLYIRKLEPRGAGALELAFRQLCDKLGKEGLFDDRHKKSLPRYPNRIVLVTSPTGAALVDMLRAFERRWPCVHLMLYPVRVQGDGAAAEIAEAIRRINDHAAGLGNVDLIIVGRGGGSLEDLWAFNEEAVARAIFASPIPIISAVGHEVDITAADLTADVRAATPTAAAELATPVLDEVLVDLGEWGLRLMRSERARLDLAASRLEGLGQRRVFREPSALVYQREQRVDELGHRLHRALVERLQTNRRRLDEYDPILQRIAPHIHLARRGIALRDAEHRLHRAMVRRFQSAMSSLQHGVQRFDRTSPGNRLSRMGDRVERLLDAIKAGVHHRLSFDRQMIRRQEDVLAAMSYKSVLGRGFSITRTKKGGRVVRSIEQVRDGRRVVSEVADGTFESEVVNLKQLELFE